MSDHVKTVEINWDLVFKDDTNNLNIIESGNKDLNAEEITSILEDCFAGWDDLESEILEIQKEKDPPNGFNKEVVELIKS